MRRSAEFLFTVALTLGCTNLPTIESNECGNAVIEEPETCDTFAPFPDSLCRPKGSVGECRLDCRTGSDGKRPACPVAWGCDTDGLCRAPTGEFESPANIEIGSVATLAGGDFDGDGRDDLFSQEAVNGLQHGKVSAHYFDEHGALSESKIFPKSIAAPFIGDISADGRADVVFTTFRIGALLGRSDRDWVPETFTSYVVPDSRVRMMGTLETGIVADQAGIIVLTTVDGVPGVYLPDGAAAELTLEGEMAGPVEELAGDPVAGQLFDDADSPCLELVPTFRGRTSFTVYDVCLRDSLTGIPGWRRPARVQNIGFEPKAKIDDHAPLIADLNGDGHLDVLLSASGTTYVAYGDGEKLATAVPYLLHNSTEEALPPAIPMPLAAGEYTGDNLPDFIFPGFLLGSTRGSVDGLPTYLALYGNNGDPWTIARIVDLNGNGIPDAVAASNTAPNVTFFNGTNSLFAVGSSLSTNNPIQQLVTGDFDGDLIRDVAFIETPTSGQDRESLLIAYGNAAGTPAAPVEVARLTGAEQLATFSDAALTALVVSSSSVVDGQRNGGIVLLDGGSDRLPLAAHTLVSFAYDGSLIESIAVSLTVGAFSGEGRHDVFALGAPDPSGALDSWLIPSIDEGRSTPVRLEGGADSRLVVTTTREDGSNRLSSAVSTADVDGDGIDESLWLLPTQDGTQCGLSWFDADLEKREIIPRGLVMLDEPCADPGISSRDFNGDIAPDVAILTGTTGSAERKLFVLWNDGAGGFSTEDSTLVSSPTDAPQAFAFLYPVPGRPAAFAYVTEGSLELCRRGLDRRTFEEPESLLELVHGTGVVAADPNGDGVMDLAIADAGNLRLLSSALERE